MFCAFRLYGDFVWPPVVGAPDAAPAGLRRGTVEIYFTQPDTSVDKWLASLTWKPGETTLTQPPTPTENIFSVRDPVQWFVDHQDQEASIWIHGRRTTDGGERVSFRGAFLFDQCDPARNSIPELRWPLVRKCLYRVGSDEVLSELIIGQPDASDSFRFNLQLPTSIPQTSLSSGLEPVSAFPFSVIYRSEVDARDEALNLIALVGGPIESREDSSFLFTSGLPNRRRLGYFGFAPNGQGRGNRFAQYKGNRHPRDRGQVSGDRVDPNRFWPRHGAGSAFPYLALLESIGISVGPERAASPIRFDAEDAVDMSFDMPALGVEGRFVSRLTFKAVRDTADGSAGKIAWTNGKFHFDLDTTIGGRLLTNSNRLHVDFILSWNISNGEIWKSDWSQLNVRLRLHWMETIAAQTTFGASAPIYSNGRPDFVSGTLPAAAYAMRSAHRALSRVEGGHPQSVMPDLSVQGDQSVRFALYAAPLVATRDYDGLIDWARAFSDAYPTSLRLSLIDAEHLIGPEIKTPLRLRGRLRGFFSDVSVTWLQLVLDHDAEWVPSSSVAVREATGEPYFASFSLETDPTPKINWTGRLSSIEFRAKLTSIVMNGVLRSAGAGMDNDAFRVTRPRIDFDYPSAAFVKFDLPFTFATPVGVDIERGEPAGRPSPLLIPTDELKDDDENDARFTLELTEYLGPVTDRFLRAEVFERSRESGDRSYVVLSEEPYSINRFSNRVLGARGDAGSSSVAIYSSHNRIWEFRRVAEYYHYSLPPQGTGESADKPRRLEIHDIIGVAGADYPGETPPVIDRPYYVVDQSTQTTGLRRRAVEFRLTPSAEIWIRPSDIERGYFMPEWESHKIFRQRGELGLGAALAALRSEFLYGLPVGVDVNRERGVARRTRVAEIEVLTGRHVKPVSTETLLGKRWNSLSRALATRPERLEVWADDPDSAIDFAPARFSDGVTFALRETALLRSPVEAFENPHEPLEAPEAYTNAPVQRQKSSIRYHPQGLSGGVLWPVESGNLFKALADNPHSSGGAIEAIALSPIGGDATQKALFLGGKVAIISQTRNGFIESHKVEVTGRIGALWHRAKHVVVYERTVNPSAQFAPAFDDDPHRTRTRRPVLRKVSEYIELLEVERSYPDFPPATLRSAGFLHHVRFNSKVINVDSAWSRDVGDYGWEIPLWNRQSARVRPQVYPMPDIAFVSLSEGDEERPVVAQECLDPDHLYFFADFVTPGSDTNLWPFRLGVDFANVPRASLVAEVVDARSATDPGETTTGSEQRRRNVSRFLPGARRFTWRLAPVARKVALNAHRSDKPMYVGLDSVTFMRCGADEKAASLFDKLGAALKGSAAAGDETLEPIDALPYWAKDGGDGKLNGAEPFSKAVDRLRVLVRDENPDRTAITRARNDLNTVWVQLRDSNSGAFASEITAAAQLYDKHLKNVGSIISGGRAQCDRLRSDAVGVIQRKAILVEALLRDWEAESDRILEDTIPSTKTEAIDALVRDITRALRPAFDNLAGGVGDIGEDIEKARAIVADIEVEIDATIKRTLARIHQFVAAYDRNKPWSDERRRAFYNGLFAGAAGLTGDVSAAIDEARQRLGGELNDAAQQVAGHVAKALQKLDVSRELDELMTFDGTILKILSTAKAVVEPFLPLPGGGILDDATGKIQGIRTKIAAANIDQATKDSLLTVISAFETDAGRLKVLAVDISDLIGRAGTFSMELDDQIAAQATEINEQLRAFVSDIAGQIEALLRLIEDAAGDELEEVREAVQKIPELVNDALKDADAWTKQYVDAVGKPVDFLVATFTANIARFARDLRRNLAVMNNIIDDVAGDVADALAGAQAALSPEGLLEKIVATRIARPSLEAALRPMTEELPGNPDPRIEIRQRIRSISASIAGAARNLGESALDEMNYISSVCGAVFEGADAAYQYLEKIAKEASTYVDNQLKNQTQKYVNELMGVDVGEVEQLLSSLGAIDQTVRRIQNDLSRSVEMARAYGDRVMDAASKLGSGGLMAAPSNILKLYSAVSSAPEIAALKADIDRLRSGFDDLTDVIETTKARALFDRLGDELKALGLSLPFDRIGDRLLPADLSNFEIGNVFRNFGGARLDKLLKGYKLPDGVRDAVRITHDFDKKQGRAWVQVDIDAPMPGRRSLFSVGIFKADFVDMRLSGQARFEVSQDNEKVTQTGHGRMGAVVDMVVSGQSMVRFEKFALNFARETGLEIEFDPKNIRLNPSFRFIQDYLSALFPDELGGMRVLKRDGIPVGLEHEFAMPPMSLNVGTSGISNISISNRFQLTAYPEFVLADRFGLSKPEQPFIFSIFIIGGTGYVQVDAEYRPFQSELSVAVEAAAGGSAALAFAFGPFSGQVFIALSVSLRYRKLLGKSGGGLSIGAVLVVAGYVNVAGIATVGIYVMLRMTYRDNGQIDADGTLSVTIRISRFFKITARANVKYKIRGGRSEQQKSTSFTARSAGGISNKIAKLQNARA